MKPDVEPAVFGLSRTRRSPPLRRLGTMSPSATLLARSVFTDASPFLASGAGTLGPLPAVKGHGHGVLGLAPAGVVGRDVPGELALNFLIQRVAARLVQVRRYVVVCLHQVEVQVMEPVQRPARDPDQVRKLSGVGIGEDSGDRVGGSRIKAGR